MSSCRAAIWTHFKQNSIFFETQKQILVPKSWFLAQPGPSLAQARFLEIYKSGTWKSGKSKNSQNSQNQNPCRPKRGGPIWGHLGSIFAWAGKIQKDRQFLFAYFPWWALVVPIHPLWALARYSTVPALWLHNQVTPEGSPGCYLPCWE